MNLREQILKEHTKTNCEKIVQWIGQSQLRFDQLFELFLSDEYRIVQRAGWPLSYAARERPVFIKKYFGKLIANLHRRGLHNAVKRNTVRLLENIPVPEEYQGELMDICFAFISDPAEKAAVKAFSLTILENMANQWPEIKPELRTVIEDRWDFETAAFKSRAGKILGRLEEKSKFKSKK